MVRVEKIEHIRLLLRDGWSIRRVSRELHVSRRIVRRAKRTAEPKTYSRLDPRSAPRLGPHKVWIDQILTSDGEKPRKQRHTAKRIYDRLVEEHQFSGDPSTVRRYVAERKRQLGRGPDVFVPLDHPAGRDGEVDWGERPVRIAGVLVTAQIFVMRACFSGLPFVKAYPTQRQEAFFDGLQEGIRFFGGVFHRLTFDNLKQAVKKVLRGRTREEQEAFSLFRSHFLFDPFFTLPGKEGAHEKGGVEGGVGYVGRNWFVPTPKFESWEDLNRWLSARCRREAGRIAQGKKRPIGELFAEEQPLLLPVPTYPFDCCRHLEPGVDSKSRVRFENNHYSVPTELAFRSVTLKAYWDKVVIVSADRVVAVHRRLYERGGTSYSPLHYLAVLERKPALWDHGEPFVNWKLPEVFAELRQELEEADPRGLRQFIRVIRAIPQSGLWAVTEAVAAALACGSSDVESILQKLKAGQTSEVPAALSELTVPVPDPKRYDTLLSKEYPDGNEPTAAHVPEETAVADDRPRL